MDKFRRKSSKFRFKSILIITFIVMICLVTFMNLFLSSNFFKKVMTDNLIESANDNLVKSAEMLNIKLQNIYQISYGISNNHEIQRFINSQNISQDMVLEDQNMVRNVLLNYCRAADYIYSVNVFKDDYNQCLSLFTFDRLENTIGFGMTNDFLLQKYLNKSKNFFYSYKEVILFYKFYNDFLAINTIGTVQRVNDETHQKEIGSVNMNIRSEYLFRHMNRMGDKYYNRIYIIDKQGNEIYYNQLEKDTDEKILPSLFLEEILKRKSGWIKKEFGGKDYILVFYTIGEIGWIVADLIPYDEIIQDFNRVKEKIILLSVVGNGLVILVFLLFASNITRPLQKMVGSFQKVQSGDFTVSVEPSSLVEINELSSNFNKMVETIYLLLKKIEIANEKERDAELKALQAQINPHFLYNTLDLIYWMTDQPEVAEIIQYLGKFFRLSLSKGKNIITIKEEIDHVSVYLRIQSIRFKEKFTYKIVVHEEIFKYSILKIILQPLVENSLLHGFKYKKKGGLIQIYDEIFEDKIIIYVEDNGTGVDIERIKHILDGHQISKGYGITNVDERIRLQYGEQYGLSYKNIHGSGAQVKVTLPLIQANDIET